MTPGFEAFRDTLTARLAETRLYPEADLAIDLILNPAAGAFTHRGRCRRVLAALDRVPHPQGPAPARRVRVSTWTTNYPGHEREILAHLREADPCGPNERRLVVVAGGDGTSRGALISALDLAPEVRADLVFFRLPFGTGNDAADARTWDEALEALTGAGPHRVTETPLRVIEVDIEGQSRHFAFNIASLGLDAFVAHLTNRLKAWFPGDSYALMVDAAALFYEAFVKVVPGRVQLSRGGQEAFASDRAFLMAVLGASGQRTYGSGKRILPDDDNFCFIEKQGLLTKLRYKGPICDGTHRGLAGVSLAAGDELRVTVPGRVPLQMDGEVLWLDPAAFPVVLRVRDPGLRVLTLAPLATGSATP